MADRNLLRRPTVGVGLATWRTTTADGAGRRIFTTTFVERTGDVNGGPRTGVDARLGTLGRALKVDGDLF